MGKTITEKILARVSGQSEVTPGEVVWVVPDVIGAKVFPALNNTPDLETFGATKLKNPKNTYVSVDTGIPPRSSADEELHIRTRNWCQKHGANSYERFAISLISFIDFGLIRPGMFLAHHDTMITAVGGIGALAIGTLPIPELYTRGKTWVKVPTTIRCNIWGNCPKGIMGRDIMHMIAGQIGPDGAVYKVLEFGGPTVSEMSIDERITICNMGNHVGVKTAIVNPDEKTLEYVRDITTKPFEAVTSDPDSVYEKILDFDISNMEPYVAAPPTVNNCKPLREVEGTPVHAGYIGSCAGGRLADLRAAATVLQGRRVHPEVKLYIVPSSHRIMEIAGREGLLQIFIEAGALVLPPTCDFCVGYLGALSSGETAITTGVLNTPGRMGSNEADIFLANAYSIAASTIEGKIVDPRKYL